MTQGKRLKIDQGDVPLVPIKAGEEVWETGHLGSRLLHQPSTDEALRLALEEINQLPVNKLSGLPTPVAVADAAYNKALTLLQQRVEEAKKQRAYDLYEEIICPMCYRLNPQHASMDYGKGCHYC